MCRQVSITNPGSRRRNKEMSKKGPSSLPARNSFPVPLGDRGENKSNIQEQRLPKSNPRRRRRNPFTGRRRNNFPDLNDVFKSTSSSPGLIRGDTFDDDDEEGYCQHSDIDCSSVLNMSIGARAALNEHARHIAKFGIDGEINLEDEMHNDNNSTDEINSETCTNVLLDDQWERFLDLSRVASSIGGSISDGIPSPPNSTTVNLYFESSSAEKSKFEEAASIEVMTDVSHDFFNSSRVNLLVTPERNRNRTAEIVITRERVSADAHPLYTKSGSSSVNGSESFGNQNESSGQQNVFEVDFGRNDADQQGSSFNLGDISRITNNTVSDTNCTLGASFQNDHEQDIISGHDTMENHYGISTSNVFGLASPSILNDSSFLLSPNASAPSRATSDECNNERTTSCTSENREDVENTEFSTVNDFRKSTKDVSPEKSLHSSSSFKSVVSSFFTEACTFAKQVASDVEKSFEGMESLPADFLRGMDIGRSDAPSPISQVLSSPSSGQEGSMKGKLKLEKSFDVALNSGSSVDTNRRSNPGSSLASVGGGDAIQIHLTGRKRYRTVVPRRVYLDLPKQQSNEEEQDSFFAVRSNPETTRVGRSLLESFEEAATSNTY